MIYVSRQEHFNAAHKLHNPKWSDERNREVFGPCANTNWHGHNYDLIVTVKGQPDPETGFVVDLKGPVRPAARAHHRAGRPQKPQPRRALHGRPDGQHRKPGHRLLANLERELPAITPARLHCVKLYETPRNFVEYYGELRVIKLRS